MADPVKVLFILGWARSGSTLLDQMMGELDGFFSSGELRWLWERGLIHRRSCGCGRPVPECPVWAEVLARGWPGGHPAPETILEWQRSETRVPHTWRLLRLPGRGPTGRPALDNYIDVVSHLYAAIAATTGAEVIVDSSKLPSDAALLGRLDEVDPYYVHLVRDPRAVAYSWSRRKQRLDPNAPAEMLRHGPLHSTNRWVLWNRLADTIRGRNRDRSLLVRYEDLVMDPGGTIDALLRLIGESRPERPWLEGRTIRLSPNHTAAGNPNRLRTGAVTLTEDDEWRARMSSSRKLVVSAIAAPWLRRYGYPVRPGPPRLPPSPAGSRAAA